MNTFLQQAQSEIKSEDFQAEAKLALQFLRRLTKVIFLVLLALSLATYIAGVQGYRYLHSSHLPAPISTIILNIEDNFNDSLLPKVKESCDTLSQKYQEIITRYLVPVIYFGKGLLSNGKSESSSIK